MAETLVPQFTVEVGAADGITDTAGVEPDATKKGAFFFVGIVSFVDNLDIVSESCDSTNWSNFDWSKTLTFLLRREKIMHVTDLK